MFAPATSIAFLNSCSYNIHVWKQGADKLEKLDVIGPNITSTASWEVAESGKRVGYIFARSSNPGDSRAYLNTFSKANKDRLGANAHIYVDFNNPFQGAKVSMSMAAGRLGTVSAAAAAAAGTEIGAWLYRANEEGFLSFGGESLALGLHFCSYAGGELEASSNGAEALGAMQEKTYSNFGLMQKKGSAI